MTGHPSWYCVVREVGLEERALKLKSEGHEGINEGGDGDFHKGNRQSLWCQRKYGIFEDKNPGISRAQSERENSTR